MKSLKYLIWLLPFAFVLSACGSDDDSDTTPQSNVQVFTGDIIETGMTNATLQGTVSTSSYAEVGVVYAQENSENVTYAKATGFESGNRKFSVAVNGLQPDAAYTYYAYVKTTDGTLVTAKDRKSFHTKSPIEVLKSNTMQYVALHDATLCWTITDDQFYSELVNKRIQASFGIAWSTEREAVTPVNNRFTTSTQTIDFNQGQTAMKKLVSLRSATTYYYVTYVTINGKLYVAPIDRFVTISEDMIAGSAPNDVLAVDLGLPSGTKWADMNVGATKAEDNGLFFPWGETVGYQPVDKTFVHTFDWGEYKWCNGNKKSQTKYCTNEEYGRVDDKTLLDLADDAAYINWGDDWRMPTAEEVSELFAYTNNEWTTLQGVEGCKFTSKSNGKSIFLPAAGCGVSESHYDLGQNGYYWSASVDQPNPYSAQYLGFKGDKVFPASKERYYGMTVRPVRR